LLIFFLSLISDFDVLFYLDSSTVIKLFTVTWITLPLIWLILEFDKLSSVYDGFLTSFSKLKELFIFIYYQGYIYSYISTKSFETLTLSMDLTIGIF